MLKGQSTAADGSAGGAVECQLGIQGMNPLLSGELWILGDPFLRKCALLPLHRGPYK